MPNKRLQQDLLRIETSLRELGNVAKAESAALLKVLEEGGSGALERLHEVHRNELDVVQALLASFEIMRRRHPDAFETTAGPEAEG